MGTSRLLKELRIQIGVEPLKAVVVIPIGPGHTEYVYYGDQVALFACDGSYWQANQNVGSRIMSLSPQIGAWEQMQVVSALDPFAAKARKPIRYNQKLSFRFAINNKFVGANLHSPDQHLHANAPTVKEWEEFRIVRHPRHQKQRQINLRYGVWCALQAHNGKYVRFDRDGSKHLLADARHIQEWEGFVFLPVNGN